MMNALHQAREGRLHILGIMNEAINSHRDNISPFAPKITQLTIPVDKIRDVIGPGGKIIRGIQADTGAEIEIEDSGTVRVFAVNAESADAAVKRIKELTAEPEINATYEGPVKSILPFGAFIEIMPGRDGLLHISEITHHRLEKVEDELAIGDIVKVKVLEINDGKVRLSRRALLDPPPEGERDDRDRKDRGDRGGPPRGDRGGDRKNRGR
jgi:polyribonucleotide nucleotidyltransferase